MSLKAENQGRTYKQNALLFMLHLGPQRSLMAEHLHWTMKQTVTETQSDRLLCVSDPSQGPILTHFLIGAVRCKRIVGKKPIDYHTPRECNKLSLSLFLMQKLLYDSSGDI